jgi:hypothetical protein
MGTGCGSIVMPDKDTDWIDEYSEWPVSVAKAAGEEFCSKITVQRWAKKNGVRTIGEGRRRQYLIFKEDVLRFRQREGPGRPWPRTNE